MELKLSTYQNEMFNFVSNLDIEVVNFTNVNLRTINGSMFAVLKSLRVLDLTNNPQLKNITVDIAQSLYHTIQELYLTQTCLGTTSSVANVIKNLMGKNITVLALDWNQIHTMGESHVFDRLPNLKILTVTHNNVHDYTGFLFNYTNAKHLKKLDISYQSTWVPSSPCGNQTVASVTETNNFRSRRRLNYFFPIWWPDKLEWLSLSNNELVFPILPAIDFMRNGSIKYIDVSNIRIGTEYQIHSTATTPFQQWNM